LIEFELNFVQLLGEFAPPGLQIRDHRLIGSDLRELSSEGLKRRATVAVHIVDKQKAVLEFLGSQALGNNLECRKLLTDDQYGFAAADAVADDIDDRLTLTGAGWTLDKYARRDTRLEDCCLLRWIAIDRKVSLVLGRILNDGFDRILSRHPERGFERCARWRSTLERSQVLSDRLAGEFGMEKSSSTDDFSGVRCGSIILVRHSAELEFGWRPEVRECLDDSARCRCGLFKSGAQGLSPLLGLLQTEKAVQGWI
jgi:hypothetical protein